MKSRNYSFLSNDPDRFDQIDIDGRAVPVPARIGSCYWAILRVAYEAANEPVYFDELAERVEALMSDRDPSRWAAYQTKPNSLPWRERIVLSARMLTRLGGSHPYGLRTAEQGMALSINADSDGKPFVILHTSLTQVPPPTPSTVRRARRQVRRMPSA